MSSSQRHKLQWLPTHILRRILRHLDHAKVVAQARLVSTAFAEAGAACTFEQVTIAFDSDQFEHMMWCPAVTDQVASIRLILNVDDERRPVAPYRESHDLHSVRAETMDFIDDHVGGSLEGWRDDVLSEELAEYVDADLAHGRVSETREIGAVLHRLFVRCVRLKKLVVIVESRFAGVEPPSIGRPASIKPEPGSSVNAVTRSDQRLGLRRLRAIVRAIESSGLQLNNWESYGLPYDIFAPGSKEDLIAMRTALGPITELTCDLSAVPSEEDELFPEQVEAGWQSAVHRGFLNSARNIRVLHLSLPSIDEPVFDIQALISGISWPHLRELTLKYAKTSQEDLLDFLGRHQGTLQIMSLAHILLSSGTWSDVMPALSASLPKLRKVVLRGKFCHVDAEGWHVRELSLQDPERRACPVGTLELTSRIQEDVLHGSLLPERVVDEENLMEICPGGAHIMLRETVHEFDELVSNAR